jgi:hypothetical protein
MPRGKNQQVGTGPLKKPKIFFGERKKKKRMILLAGLLAAVLFGQDAMATMLEDILKEKGVITDSENQEVNDCHKIFT